MTWAEDRTPREWQFYATCSQMRADQRRLERAQERREFWRETKCELAAGALAIGTVLLLVGIRLWVMAA